MSFVRCLVAVVAALLVAGQLRAQAAWEYTAYDVRLLIALEPSPRLPVETVDTLVTQTAKRADVVLRAVWKVSGGAAPASLHAEILNGLDTLSAERLAALDSEVLTADKLYLISVSEERTDFHVAVREVDCRTRQLGPVITRPVRTLQALPFSVWDAVADAFIPLARIEVLEESRVVARLRAGGLIVDAQSPALVEAGMLLRPVIRRNDRTGQPMKNGIQAVPWTLMTVGSRTDSLLECTLHSGYRGAIPTRGGLRTERLALLVRPRYESTRLVLRARHEAGKPLAGYEVHARRPDDKEAELLGLTDELGSIDLLRTDGSLRLLFVRNGTQLLARLPIMPGQASEMVANVVDDEGRLQAEGFVAALHSRALDLVARREILAARIRARLKEGQFTEAQALLDDFRKLDTRHDLLRELDQQRQQVTAGDPLTQTRINKLFADAQKLLLLKPLSDDMLNQLTRELAAARTGKTASTSAGTGK